MSALSRQQQQQQHHFRGRGNAAATGSGQGTLIPPGTRLVWQQQQQSQQQNQQWPKQEQWLQQQEHIRGPDTEPDPEAGAEGLPEANEAAGALPPHNMFPSLSGSSRSGSSRSGSSTASQFRGLSTKYGAAALSGKSPLLPLLEEADGRVQQDQQVASPGDAYADLALYSICSA
jgi:hypothetical protein